MLSKIIAFLVDGFAAASAVEFGWRLNVLD